MAEDKSREQIIEEAVQAALDAGEGGVDGVPNVDVVSARTGFKVKAAERNAAMDTIRNRTVEPDDQNEAPPGDDSPAPIQADPQEDAVPKGAPKGVPATTLEAVVQVAALLHRRDGTDGGGDYLLRKCGQVHVQAVADADADPDKIAAWAYAEARRRSPKLDHQAIVAQRIA
jgi:hypothetical protein